MCVLVAQSCLTLCDSMDCSPPGSSPPWNSPGKNTEWVPIPSPGVLHYSTLNFFDYLTSYGGFPGGSEDKASACNAGDPGSILGLGRSFGEGNGNPLQYLCPENAMDRGARYATVHRVAKSWTRLSNLTFTQHIKKHTLLCNKGLVKASFSSSPVWM